MAHDAHINPGAAATPATAGDLGESLTYLATTDVSAREWRVAWWTIGLSALVVAILLPFAKVQLAPIPAFVPIWAATQLVTSLVTAVLLLGQYVRLRSASLLALCAGYLFTAAVIIPYLLAFPGAFSPDGPLIGSPQTAAWIYVLWHGGLPVFIIAYALLRGVETRASPARTAVVASILVLILVAAVVVLSLPQEPYLPRLLDGNTKTPESFLVFGSICVLSLIALLVVWLRGVRSSLDLWIAVVMVAWICDVLLSSVFNAGRYDLGYYFGRIYGIVAVGFVLAVVLLETSGLHGRIIATATRLRGEVAAGRARQRAAEEQLRQAQKMEAIGSLTGGMAHDFNNLLAIIIGNLDILVSQKKDDVQVRALGGEALDAALRGADLTQRMLAFARRQPLQPRRLDLNGALSNITRLLSRTIGQNIEIVLDLDPDLWPVQADPSQVDSAIANLATNARDAMADGGSLIIVTGNRHLDADYAAQYPDVSPGDYAMIEVSDTGTGMPPELIQRIFEPFFTTKDENRGTGLGLSMVYGFIKQSGGHVSVYSEPGVGTTFRLYLPRDESGAMVATKPPVPMEMLAGHGETVLAVEDNVSLRRVVVRQLHELGYRVLEAENAPSAMNVLAREPVDVLFSDVIMTGGVSGIELSREALSRWPHLKVLLTSGFPEAKKNGNGNGNGHGPLPPPAPARLLNKPYRKEDLARALREVIAG